MDSLLVSALLAGLIGSLHCAGMCGPIALMLPRAATAGWLFLLGRLLYNLGRVITYAVLGAICGLLGHLIALAGYQQILSIAVGAAILIALLLPSKITRKISPSFVTAFADKMKNWWARLLGSHSLVSLFWIGLLNGFLPCGLLYVALAAASTSGSLWGGSAYMILFGLGTIPMILAISLFGGLLPLAIRQHAPRILYFGTIVIAVLLILRGLSLGIPYISPRLKSHLEKPLPVSIQKPLTGSDCCK